MRFCFLAMTAFAACFAQEFRGETLADVLASHNVPAQVLPAADLQIPINSAGWSARNSLFLIAYYDTFTETLPDLLHVVRYDEVTKETKRTDLRGAELPFHGFDGVMNQPSSDCMGAVLSILEDDGLVTIETHINPSAGCVLLLTQDLKFSAGLYGWVLGHMKHEIILEESMVHFSSVHDARLAVYDVDTKKLVSIYPSQQEHERQLFSTKLAKHMPPAAWCAEQNNPCDPKSFNAEIEHLKVDDGKRSFVFDVQMTSDGFGPEAALQVKPKTVHYVCEKINGEWLLSSKEQPRPSAP